MLKWKIGDVSVSRVVEMELTIPYNPAAPFLKEAEPDKLTAIPWLKPHFITDEGAMKFPFQAFLVEGPGFRLVVDTCIGNDKPRRELGMQALQTGFLDNVEKAGFDRHSVDTVVCTHLHVDHVGWNTMLKDGKWVPTFPNARYLFGQKDYEHWRDFDDQAQQEVMADSVAPILDAGLADLVQMDHRISPEVRLVPTTGHTPGHVSILIESRGEQAVITGDMMHHPCQVAHPDWSPDFDTDKLAAAATRRAMLKDWADQPILVIGSHFAAPTAGRVFKDGDSYRFEPV